MTLAHAHNSCLNKQNECTTQNVGLTGQLGPCRPLGAGQLGPCRLLGAGEHAQSVSWPYDVQGFSFTRFCFV